MSNRQIRQLKAQVVAELARLDKENDGLRPSEVVEAAKPKTSPLHAEFTWDDKKAAHEFRLNEARQIIRVVVWDDKTQDGTPIPGRYVHIPDNTADEEKDSKEGVYRPISVVIQNVDQFARALSGLVGKVNSATEAARELREAAQAAPDGEGAERLMKIGLAITALETASAAVASLH